MKQYLQGIFIFSLLLAPFCWANTSPHFSPYSGQWVLTEQNGKVAIYTQAHQDSDFAAFKAEAILEGSIDSIFAVIADPQSCQHWVDGCIHSKPAGGSNFGDRLGYALNHLPWPFSDRDIVVHILTHGDQFQGTINITMESTSSEDFPEMSGIVRVTQSYTLYYLEKLSESQTRFTWIQHADPSGALPAWLVNSRVIDLPTKTIPRLEALAKETQYANARLIYGNEGQLLNVRLGDSRLITSLYDFDKNSETSNALVSNEQKLPATTEP